ncbi:MAG: hypothetical protein J0M29_10095 [Chitinophagales bacterium]|nr:hypothetical protein [Chitinophagales bacterium]
MKAPDQNHSSATLQELSSNYSMLPPEKLPKWLVEKNAPPKILNFSMRPPEAVTPMVQRSSPVQETWTPSPLSFEPAIIESDPMVEPDKIPEATAIVVESEMAQEILPEPVVEKDDSKDLNPPEHSEVMAVLNAPPLVEETTPAMPDRPTLQPALEESPPPLMDSHNPVLKHVPPPVSNSFGDWVMNNSNTSIIIVAGIIIFAIVLIILLSIGII